MSGGVTISLNMTIEIVDRQRWRTLAADYQDYNYRQCWDFGVACADRLGAGSEHVVVRHGPEIIGMADVRIKLIPLFNAGIAYINGGPLVRRGDSYDRQRLSSVLDALQAQYVYKRGMVLRVAPVLGAPEWNTILDEVLTTAGFQPTTQVARYRTIMVDIQPPLEQIRKALAQKWRNCLNRAEKNELTLSCGTDGKLFDTFRTLFDELLDRKGFGVELDAEFYAQLQQALELDERFLISLAEYEGQPIAGHIASILGDTCVYLLGASNDLAMKHKASYLLQWHVIMQARERGCHWYDLGGIDPEANPGVYHFKRGMGGTDVTAPGPYEQQPHSVKRHLVAGGERLYRWMKQKHALRR